jgi:hypothetical protein
LSGAAGERQARIEAPPLPGAEKFGGGFLPPNFPEQAHVDFSLARSAHDGKRSAQRAAEQSEGRFEAEWPRPLAGSGRSPKARPA